MEVDALAVTYSVSRAWVHQLQQRRRETGSIAPRRQTRWRTPGLTLQPANAPGPSRAVAWERTRGSEFQIGGKTRTARATIGMWLYPTAKRFSPMGLLAR
jgi:hypothetical protein